ncbi:MAG TPA: metallophosphoesterase, partial [Blastocatellia bacterium]|nr:metallophosphoesterase [Blastocatellia bacterium]
DLLAVTGDLIDGSMMGLFKRQEARTAFFKVYTYLHNLCKELKIDPASRLIVVPGNHDLRLKGIFRRRVQSSKFYEQFKDSFRPIFQPSLGIYVFAFDSNAIERGINLATGLIEKNDLLDFFDFVQELRANKVNEWNSYTKIALLHHHPMPIAETEGKGFLEQPGFLLLKNAGQFMTSMVKSRVDIVLHGHQHYPAFSKASFPTNNGFEHLMTIIGAGTVGAEARNYSRSYNLITVTDSREIHLERRWLTGAEYQMTFKVPVKTNPIQTDEGARQALFETQAAKAEAKLRVKKFSRHYVIKEGSGDADLYERFEGTTAYSKKLDRFDTEIHSVSGFFYTPEYDSPDGQNITWHWKEKGRIGPKREAWISFDPPITKENPIIYNRHSKAYNLFHFNQKEREDATDGKWSEEYIEIAIQNAFDLLVVTVTFPEGHFPEKFYRMVHNDKCYRKAHDETCIRDSKEEEYFNLNFSKFKGAKTISISLQKPLPGYTYLIYWSLPNMEEDERPLDPTVRGRAADLVEKLLQLKSPNNSHEKAVQLWLENMRTDIITSQLWRDLPPGDDKLEISLYAYDNDKKGLICVAASFPDQTSGIATWSKVIKSGQTLIGAAYRRKEPMLFSPLANPAHDEAEYINRVPEDWRAASLKQPYTAICVIPLMYPLPKGCKVAVLTFATRSKLSRLLHFVPQEQRSKTIKAAGDALVEDVLERQFKKLAEVLDIKY